MKLTWFPLYQEMLESERYINELTDTEKVLYMLTISEKNLYKQKGKRFYRSREWFAAALNVDIKTITRAWDKIERFEWLRVERGFSTVNKTMPTDFKDVYYADVTDIRHTGKSYYQFDRYTFNLLLAHMRRGKIKPVHIFVYAICLYLHRVNSQNGFEYKTKTWLEKTGFSKIAPLKLILDDLQKLGLIDFEKPHGKIVIKSISTMKANERNLIDHTFEWNQEITNQANKLKANRTSAKRKNYLDGETPENIFECIDMFEQLSRKKFPKAKITILEHHKQSFINQQYLMSPEKFGQKIREYVASYTMQPQMIFQRFILELLSSQKENLSS